jgi:UDP-N-acetylmuramoylalanine--D-glutamate ligase
MAEPGAEGLRADLAGRRVLVCGAGVAGRSAVRALLAFGADVSIADRAGDGPDLAALTGAGASFVGTPGELPDGVSLVVTSPGWRPDHPLLADALGRGVEVLGEVEFAWRLRSPAAGPWLAVTGTNGKTTTVRMLEAILRAGGERALAVGNVGEPIIDAVLAEPRYDVLAVEVSSFQLYWSSTLAPAAGVLLNLAPDHLDWHGSMAAYAEAKARVWAGAVAIGNADDPAVAELLPTAVAGERFSFTLGAPGPGQLGVLAGELTDRLGADAVPLVPAADVRPAGEHNVANALAAAALARVHGAGADAVARGLCEFVPDPHRNQLIVTEGGVAFVDDSKATNPHAASASLHAYERIVWIAGGQLKGAPVDALVADVAPRLAGVVLLGADRALIAASLRRHAPDIPVIDVASTDDKAMTEVVRAAAGLARPGDTVLLAPAGASYDMFTGYAQRGTLFAKAVQALTSGETR